MAARWMNMFAETQSGDVLVIQDFASESEVGALVSAFRALVAARSADHDLAGVRMLPFRTEVLCRKAARICEPVIGARVASVRDRVLATMKQFFHMPGLWPDLTLLSEMRAGDSHPLHADAERQTPEGWGPNHTFWRTHVGLLYLNTSSVDYHGGLLRLPGVARTIAPMAGMFVAFPTDHRYAHEVTRIEDGQRLSLAIWLTADSARAEAWLTRPRKGSAGRRPVPHREVGDTRHPAFSVGRISNRRAAALIRIARSTLAEVAGGTARPRNGAGPNQVRVNVTVYVRQRLQASMSGSGTVLEDAVREAAARAASDVRFGRALAADDLPDARVELWIQTANEVIDNIGNVDLGLDGIAIFADGRSAYYKPSVALTSGVARHDLLLDKLTKRAGLLPGAWQDSRTTLQRTSWEHYCEVPENPNRVLHLRRLRPATLDALTAAALHQRARLAADHLMAVQSDEGHYLYRFHPFKSREKPGPGNLVRQAGCAYAMARGADSAESPERRALLAASACRVIDVLLNRIIAKAGTVFIEDLPTAGKPARGKLGTVALTLAAIQCPSLGTRYKSYRPRLLEAVLAFQRPDGSFRCRSDSTSISDDGTSQDYFPGEALLSLAVETRAGSAEAERAMAAALPWYRARFRAQPARGFVLWQLDAWRLRATWPAGLERPAVHDARTYCEFIFEMADWLLQFQIADPDSHPDLIGGYAPHGRSPGCSTAVYTEAIVRAFEIAELFGDRSRADRYRQASLLGLDFIRRLQVMPDTGILFPDPARTVGATTASLSDMTIRCDYDQHTLTAFLAALETKGLLEPQT